MRKPKMLEILSTPEAWISLVTLTALEIVLGIDNIVFITILAGKLPQDQQLRTRRLGLAVALISRLVLLASISWVMSLQKTLFTLMGHDFSARDLILIVGGLFLVAKATIEIYDKVEAVESAVDVAAAARAVSVRSILIQIMALDIVFSLDSVITAVGMADHLEIMAAAVIIAVGVMLVFAGPIGDFVDRRPSIKILALSFLVMIGVLLVAEGTGHHLNKGYIYFGMAFALVIEMINMRYRKNVEKVESTGSKATAG